MTRDTSPWSNYPPDYAPPDTDDTDEPYQPAPLVTAIISLIGFVVVGLAVWKAEELLGALYTYSGG